ncbi:MAG: T9SS type A sorting domain-containing protein [Flavobacterium sp.]|nr:T9SS type A sorting domain-containing protein [Flavobacterium sp.]
MNKMKGKDNVMKSLLVLMFLFSFQGIRAQIWPASTWSGATNLTSVMNAVGVTDLSGLHFNPTNNRLYGVQDDGRLRVLQWDLQTNLFAQIANVSIGGGPEGVTQANLYANEFYTIDENNYEIRRYVYSTNFSTVTEYKHWNLLLAPSIMEDTGNTGPEGIVFIPDSFLSSIGFVSEQTGQPYTSVKGLGGLFFVANQDQGNVWVFDVNPNANNDFAFVGKYETNRTESCDLAFDRSTGLLYILHNISGNNRLEVTDLSTASNGGMFKFTTLKDYLITNPSGNNDNIEGFALTPKCPENGITSAWLSRDVGTSEASSIKQDVLRWFSNFVADGSCEILANNHYESSENFAVAPNPVGNELRIHGSFDANATIQVFDSLGRIRLHKKAQSNFTDRIDVSNLSPGIYLISVQQMGKNNIAKFLKE